MSEVVPVRIDKELLSKVDAMIEMEAFPSRSSAIREATRELVSKTLSKAANDRLEAVARAAAAMIADRRIEGVNRIMLYGSVARKEAGEDSDIDLLVLTDKGCVRSRVLTAVVDVTAPIEVATETVITPIVRERARFDRMFTDGFSFATQVARDGVVLFEGPS